MSETLHTERLTLRPMQPEDAEELHDFFADPEATRFFGNWHRSLEETRQWVTRSAKADPLTTREYTLLRDGHAIGKAGIWEKPELGFFLSRAAWGQGLMREALTDLIPHLFKIMALDHMTADVDPLNAASLNLLKSLGFRETGRAERTIQIEGQWADSVYLSLTSAPEPRARP